MTTEITLNEVAAVNSGGAIIAKPSGFTAQEIILSELETEWGTGIIFDCTDTKQFKRAKELRSKAIKARTSLNKDRLEMTRKLDAAKTQIISRERELENRIRAIENPIDEQIKAEEYRLEKIAAEKARLEQERIDAIKLKIVKLNGMAAFDPFNPPSSAAIDEKIVELDGIEIEQSEYQEFTEHAEFALHEARTSLTNLYNRQLQSEREKAELEALRAKLAEQTPEPLIVTETVTETQPKILKLGDEVRVIPVQLPQDTDDYIVHITPTSTADRIAQSIGRGSRNEKNEILAEILNSLWYSIQIHDKDATFRSWEPVINSLLS